MLYKCCDRLGIPPGEAVQLVVKAKLVQAFSQVQYSRGTYSHPSVWELGDFSDVTLHLSAAPRGARWRFPSAKGWKA